MALGAHWYTLAAYNQWSGNPVNWISDPINCALVSSSYIPNQDTDQYWSVPKAFEITGTGYTAGGVTMTTAVGIVVSPHIVPLLASNVSWPMASFTARYAIIYKVTGSAATSPLIGYADFGTDQNVSGGTFELAWDPTYGVLQPTAN